MYNSNSKGLLKISLKLQEDTTSIDIEPYKFISAIREKAYQKFYPLHIKLKMFYGNKDLGPYEDRSIGDYFKGKKQIIIRLVDANTVVPSVNKSSDSNELPNIYPRRGNSSYIRGEFCQSCGDNPISSFCRECKIFLCKGCKSKEPHNIHRSTNVNFDNLVESLKHYSSLIESDISLNLKAYEKHSVNFEKQKIIDPSARKEIILRKIQQIENINKELSNKLPKLNVNKVSSFENFAMKANLIEKDLNRTMQGVDQNELNFDEATHYFDYLYDKDQEISGTIKEISAYRMHMDLNKKLDDMYKIIEKALDAVIISESGKVNFEEDSGMLTKEMIDSMKNDIKNKKRKIKSQEPIITEENDNSKFKKEEKTPSGRNLSNDNSLLNNNDKKPKVPETARNVEVKTLPSKINNLPLDNSNSNANIKNSTNNKNPVLDNSNVSINKSPTIIPNKPIDKSPVQQKTILNNSNNKNITNNNVIDPRKPPAVKNINIANKDAELLESVDINDVDFYGVNNKNNTNNALNNNPIVKPQTNNLMEPNYNISPPIQKNPVINVPTDNKNNNLNINPPNQKNPVINIPNDNRNNNLNINPPNQKSPVINAPIDNRNNNLNNNVKNLPNNGNIDNKATLGKPQIQNQNQNLINNNNNNNLNAKNINQNNNANINQNSNKFEDVYDLKGNKRITSNYDEPVNNKNTINNNLGSNKSVPVNQKDIDLKSSVKSIPINDSKNPKNNNNKMKYDESEEEEVDDDYDPKKKNNNGKNKQVDEDDEQDDEDYQPKSNAKKRKYDDEDEEDLDDISVKKNGNRINKKNIKNMDDDDENAEMTPSSEDDKPVKRGK